MVLSTAYNLQYYSLEILDIDPINHYNATI